MGNDVAKLAVKIMQPRKIALPLKDMILCLKNKAQYVADLEDDLTKLTAEMAAFYSKKKKIDQILEMAVFKEKSDEYHILLKQIEVFRKTYNKFMHKYHKDCQNLQSVVAEPEAVALTECKVTDHNQTAIMDLDISSACNVIDALQARKPIILTRKFFRLAKLSKDIKNLYDHITSVTSWINVMLEKKVEPVQVKHDDIDLPSFTEYVKEILTYLREDEYRSIGIVGPIGVGKTIIMKKLNNQLMDTSSSFSGGTRMMPDVVIWIDYYYDELNVEDTIIEMMQDVIMERLKLTKTVSIEQNADIISTALEHKKYILLIDQVSSNFDLEKVGIYKGHKFGKVVVASTSIKTIKQMTCHQVKIQPLSNDDALDLFQKFCGTIYDRRIKLIAKDIVSLCGGLPLVIKLVAAYLKDEENENLWSEVKRALKSESKAAKYLNLGGVDNAYKLAYGKLCTSQKKCLLFVALFPSDCKISKDYLVECWNAERFLEIDTSELRSARAWGAIILKELTDHCLLEQCSDNNVKMPVYFRKLALEQEYPGEDNCVVWVPDMNKRLTEETWRTTRRMSLISSNTELPYIPVSHKISTLLLQWNPELVKLEDLFFMNMQNLCILDLKESGIETLPCSICRLGNLRSLYLNDCSLLSKLPPGIKMLTKLEVLDIRGISIQTLPNDIGDMFHLRCLRISFSKKVCNRSSKGKAVEMAIPLNIISRLKQLEELTIEAGCCNQAWNSIVDKLADELASLDKLNTLSFHFPSVRSLGRFVTRSISWKNTKTQWIENAFRSFQISIGCCETGHSYGLDISGLAAKRQLRFSSNEATSSVAEVLRQASSFELVGHSTVESLNNFDLHNAGALKVCILEHCEKLVSVVTVVGTSTTNEIQVSNLQNADYAVLQCLEKLHLLDLPFLQSIWKGSISPGCLANLKVLTLCGCPELTEVLTYDVAKALSNLKHLKVESCSKIVEIVKAEIPNKQNISEDIDISDILHAVKTVELVNLPELQSICKPTSLNWKSLRKIEIISCNKLRDLALCSSTMGKLETIKCEACWWTALQLREEEKQLFFPLCDFIVCQAENFRLTLEIISVDHAHKEENPLESSIVAEAENSV